jgi:hypothetical protein
MEQFVSVGGQLCVTPYADVVNELLSELVELHKAQNCFLSRYHI